MVDRLCLRAGLSTPALAWREGTAAAPSINVSLLGQVLPTLGTLVQGTRIASPAGAAFGMELALLWSSFSTPSLARREGATAAPSVNVSLLGQVLATLDTLVRGTCVARPVGVASGVELALSWAGLSTSALARREGAAVAPSVTLGTCGQVVSTCAALSGALTAHPAGSVLSMV